MTPYCWMAQRTHDKDIPAVLQTASVPACAPNDKPTLHMLVRTGRCVQDGSVHLRHLPEDCFARMCSLCEQPRPSCMCSPQHLPHNVASAHKQARVTLEKKGSCGMPAAVNDRLNKNSPLSMGGWVGATVAPSYTRKKQYEEREQPWWCPFFQWGCFAKLFKAHQNSGPCLCATFRPHLSAGHSLCICHKA